MTWMSTRRTGICGLTGGAGVCICIIVRRGAVRQAAVVPSPNKEYIDAHHQFEPQTLVIATPKGVTRA